MISSGSIVGMHASLLLLLTWRWAAPEPEPLAPPVRLQWEAPPACPDLVAVQKLTERLLGRPLDDARHPRVEATARVRRGGAWSAELRLATASGRQSRTLRARSCEALAEATALLLALTIDPTASLAAPADTPASDPPDPPVPLPVAPPPAPGPPVVVGPRLVGPPVVVGPRLVVAVPAPGPRRGPSWPRGFVAAGFHLDLGALPGPGFGFLAAGGLRWRRARLLAAASFAASRPRELIAAPELRVRGDQWWVGLAGCATLPRGRVELPLCAGWFAGAVRTRVGGLASGGELRLPWTGALVETGLRVHVHPRVALALSVGGKVSVLRPSFRVENLGIIHQTRPIGAHGHIGLDIRLP